MSPGQSPEVFCAAALVPNFSGGTHKILWFVPVLSAIEISQNWQYVDFQRVVSVSMVDRL